MRQELWIAGETGHSGRSERRVTWRSSSRRRASSSTPSCPAFVLVSAAVVSFPIFDMPVLSMPAFAADVSVTPAGALVSERAGAE